MLTPSFVHYCPRRCHVLRGSRGAHHLPPDFCHIGNERSAPLPLLSPSIGDPDWLRPRRQAIPLLCWLMSSRGRPNPTGRHETITAVDLPSWVHSPHGGSGWANSASFDGRFSSARWARLRFKRLDDGSAPHSLPRTEKPVRQYQKCLMYRGRRGRPVPRIANTSPNAMIGRLAWGRCIRT